MSAPHERGRQRSERAGWPRGAAGALAAATRCAGGLAFATLAGSTEEARLGQTMGAAELGRELGDAGGPLFVAGCAAVATLTVGYGALAAVMVIAAPVLIRGKMSSSNES